MAYFGGIFFANLGGGGGRDSFCLSLWNFWSFRARDSENRAVRDSRFCAAEVACIQYSEECQKPQPPLLLKKVSQYTSNLYCNTPPICIAVLLVPLCSEEREICQYSSHLYRSTPPICIAIRLPSVSQYFWENLGGCGHRDVPQYYDRVTTPEKPRIIPRTPQHPREPRRTQRAPEYASNWGPASFRVI